MSFSFIQFYQNEPYEREREREDLTALRWPRSSGGSFRSLTASMTVDKRSTSFFSVFGDLFDCGGEEEEEEDEADLVLGPPRPTTAVDLGIKDHDVVMVLLASRVELEFIAN